MEPADKGSIDNGSFFLTDRAKIAVLLLSGSLLAPLQSSRRRLKWPTMVFGALLDFYGRDWPLSIMSLDRDSQTVKFVQPNTLNRSGLPVGENDGLPDELSLRVPERVEDRRGAELCSCHGYPQSQSGERASAVVLPLKGVQVVAGRGHTSVGKNPSESSNHPMFQPGSALTPMNSMIALSRTQCFKNWRQPDHKNLCFREHRFWRQRHISNHDCNQTRSKTPTHRGGHRAEFASMHPRL